MTRRILVFLTPAFLTLAFLTLADTMAAQEHAHYDIERASSAILIDGTLDEQAWTDAPAVGDFSPMAPEPAVKQQTIVKMLWDDENLYVGYYMIDNRISAYVTERHGPVSRDDCVEIFLSPGPSKVTNYYTFEINAIGTMLNRCKTGWWTGPPTWEPDGVRYKTSFHGRPEKNPSPNDHHWIVEMAIPFRNFSNDSVHTPPEPGDQWRLNLHRLDEGLPKTAAGRRKQRTGFSTWSPLPPEVQSFHSPAWFGWVRFVK